MSPSSFSLDPGLFTNPDIPCLAKHSDTKTDLLRENCIMAAFSDNLPPPEVSISDIMSAMEKAINQAAVGTGFAGVNPNAFNNARGSWFESLVAVTLWNLRIDNPEFHEYLIIKLPNVSIMKFIELFEPQANSMLHDLEKSLKTSGVNLITSNPDILCVTNLLGVDSKNEYLGRCDNCSKSSLENIVKAYMKIIGKCRYDSIKFGMALKASMRPDRRLQIPHEGSILKAINAHLQTRFWDAGHQVRYYAATATPITHADIEAFKTAATHSIVDVNVKPISAVDKSFYLENLGDIKRMLEECLP